MNGICADDKANSHMHDPNAHVAWDWLSAIAAEHTLPRRRFRGWTSSQRKALGGGGTSSRYSKPLRREDRWGGTVVETALRFAGRVARGWVNPLFWAARLAARSSRLASSCSWGGRGGTSPALKKSLHRTVRRPRRRVSIACARSLGRDENCNLQTGQTPELGR